jgi:hypothetical protein
MSLTCIFANNKFGVGHDQAHSHHRQTHWSVKAAETGNDLIEACRHIALRLASLRLSMIPAAATKAPGAQ